MTATGSSAVSPICARSRVGAGFTVTSIVCIWAVGCEHPANRLNQKHAGRGFVSATAMFLHDERRRHRVRGVESDRAGRPAKPPEQEPATTRIAGSRNFSPRRVRSRPRTASVSVERTRLAVTRRVRHESQRAGRSTR
jgi:hypothetical protein